MVISLMMRTFIKMFIIIGFSTCIYVKITNRKKFDLKEFIIIEFGDIVLSLVYVIIIEFISKVTVFIIVTIIKAILLLVVSKDKKSYFIFSYMLSILISYVLYATALVVSGLLLAMIAPEVDYASLISLFTIFIVYMLLYFAVLNSKRLKNGVNFLNKVTKEATYCILLLIGIMIVLFEIIPKDISYVSQESIFVGSSIIAVSLFLIIKSLITKHYKNNMRDRTIRIQKEEIDTNVKMIEELKEQNLKLSTTIHKYNHRLSSLENSIRKAMSSINVEFAKELSVVLEQTQNVATQFAQETKVDIKLPVTNVISVDNMMEFMRDEIVKCGIDFTFKLSDSIKPLLDKYISEDKFETLLADHIKDAIIAINAKSEGYKGIMVLVGVCQGAYEVSIYDTGIEFDISTLLKLGTEPVTTHKDNGGSGLGFMTTFETLKSSKASLVIEEYDTRVTNYTKSVTIRFDNKCEYRIYSYRAEEIKKCCNGRKIIIRSI